MLESWQRDLRHAAPGLAATPTYAGVVMATLALVIGAASAVNATMGAATALPAQRPPGPAVLMPLGSPLSTNQNPFSPGVFHRLRDGCGRSKRWQDCGRGNALGET